ncbi:MAG: DUF6786 family protein [Chloroflexota bacterium]
MRLLFTEYGSRVMPFLAEDTPCLYWLNPVLWDAAALRDFIAAGEWNMGGERMWIAPEIQFNIHDRTDFWGTHRVPREIDPGMYRMLTIGGQVHFSQQVGLQAYNTATGTLYVDMRRTVQQIANPLRHTTQFDDLMTDVQFAGYAQTATMSILGGDSMYAETWNLIQLNAGGTLFIPSGGEGAVRYFGEPADDAMTTRNGAYRIHLTGQQQYKMGYKAAFLSGRMGYLNQTPDGTHYLFVRQFNNDPTTVYAEEPPDSPGVQGHSVHVYNDGGQFGGNAEMEANGRTIGGDTGQTTMTDTYNMWMFFSSSDIPLRRIGQALMGIDL